MRFVSIKFFINKREEDDFHFNLMWNSQLTFSGADLAKQTIHKMLFFGRNTLQSTHEKKSNNNWRRAIHPSINQSNGKSCCLAALFFPRASSLESFLHLNCFVTVGMECIRLLVLTLHLQQCVSGLSRYRPDYYRQDKLQNGKKICWCCMYVKRVNGVLARWCVVVVCNLRTAFWWWNNFFYRSNDRWMNDKLMVDGKFRLKSGG